MNKIIFFFLLSGEIFFWFSVAGGREQNQTLPFLIFVFAIFG